MNKDSLITNIVKVADTLDQMGLKIQAQVFDDIVSKVADIDDEEQEQEQDIDRTEFGNPKTCPLCGGSITDGECDHCGADDWK